MNGKEAWAIISPIIGHIVNKSDEMSDAYITVFKALKAYDESKIEKMVQAEAIEWEADEAERSGIGERIKKAMSDKGISQREIAEKCHITDVSLSRYIRGERIPKATVIGDIANALRVSTDYLVLGKEDT